MKPTTKTNPSNKKNIEKTESEQEPIKKRPSKVVEEKNSTPINSTDEVSTISRRATTAVNTEENEVEKMLKKRFDKDHTKKKEKSEYEVFKEDVKWWQKPSVVYAMSMCKEILEILMGTTLVVCMSRVYMDKLKKRVLEYYSELVERRVEDREEKDYQRVKNLVLSGKIPFSKAPDEMSDHIVMYLEKYCNEIIQKRRLQYNLQKPAIPSYLYWDDTPDLPYRLSIEIGHKYRSKDPTLCHNINNFLFQDLPQYLFEEHDFKKLKYTHITVRQLFKFILVPNIYDFADYIMKKELPEMGYKPKSQMQVFEDVDSIFTEIFGDDENNEDDSEENDKYED